MCSCRRDKKDFLFLTDEISRKRKPCTPDIGIDLRLYNNPDIYLLANCKRQDPFSVERIRLTEEQCIFFYAFLDWRHTLHLKGSAHSKWFAQNCPVQPELLSKAGGDTRVEVLKR